MNNDNDKMKLVGGLIKNKFPDVKITEWVKMTIGPDGTVRDTPVFYWILRLDIKGTKYEEDDFKNKSFYQLEDYTSQLRKFTNLRYVVEYITTEDDLTAF